MPGGNEIRQGDVYLYPLDNEPVYARVLRDTLQLAPGEGPGSRHVVVGNAVSYRRPHSHGDLEGPLLHARERVLLTHPEHADISLPAGWYEIMYQRDYSVGPMGIPHRVWD